MSANISSLLITTPWRLGMIDVWQRTNHFRVQKSIDQAQIGKAAYKQSFLPRGKKPAPYGREVSPQRQGYPSHGRSLLPQGNLTPPRGQPCSPHGQQALPHEQMFPPQGGAMKPHGRRLPPCGRRVSPQRISALIAILRR